MLDFDQSYIDIMESLEVPSDNDIEKAFVLVSDAYDLGQISQEVFEKAQHTYMNNKENQRLKRVGKPYGKAGEENQEPEGKENKTEPSKDKKESEKSIEQHAKEASQTALESTVKDGKDAELRAAAHQELDRREKEEHVQEEEPKENKETTSKEPKTSGSEDTSKKKESSGVKKEDKPVTVNKIKSFKTDEGKFSVYDIDDSRKNRGDMFTVLEDKKGWIVRNALVPDELQKNGVATAFYTKMNDLSIQKTGNLLRSTQERKLSNGEKVHELSDLGKKLWDSLVKKGLANKISDKNYVFIDSNKIIKLENKSEK